MRLGRDLLSASSPKEPEPRQCLAPAQPPLAQNHLQNVDRSNPLQCRAPSPQSTPTRLLDLSASKILTPTIFPLKTDRKSTEDDAKHHRRSLITSYLSPIPAFGVRRLAFPALPSWNPLKN